MIRRATPEDVPAITGLIYDLAEYEKARHECTVVPEQIHEALFGPQPSVYAHVAEESGADGTEGQVVGVALWFRNFSTWDGVHGIYLEDLFVRPEHRGRGHGRALLAALAHECVERGYTRLSWSVLDWNEPSIGFYRSLGAVAQDEWTTFRLSGAALQALGS
ncbi:MULTISPECIES: GNAT family N-acetyltransferase [Rhodococcus]|uniref:GNAT family N-acetyltransferase n=1 Tax=Rhodococcus TaxID=1827 RepID=UPI0013285CC3|nr:GNAT family N-acetyltransferase [Rhodococcus sp. RDE2]MXQ75330.1 GNAT family N-acetyltransferase [Rhodococcus rhodochrous]BDB61523.1 putative acetyltransferase [Rhodococcus sp. RDE2]